jgi:hypothetical protein
MTCPGACWPGGRTAPPAEPIGCRLVVIA